jgi:hypothetical protein
MHPLGKLIQRIQDENGWSNVDIANRAIERGHKTSKQSIGEYKKKPVVTINARQIGLLADGLGIAPMTVVLAAAESMGIQDDLHSDDDLEAAVRTTTELTERDKRLVLSLLDAMRTDESSEHDTDTSKSDPPNLRAVPEDHHAEDAEPEQKIAAYDRDLGDNIKPGDLPSES